MQLLGYLLPVSARARGAKGRKGRKGSKGKEKTVLDFLTLF